MSDAIDPLIIPIDSTQAKTAKEDLVVLTSAGEQLQKTMYDMAKGVDVSKEAFREQVKAVDAARLAKQANAQVDASVAEAVTKQNKDMNDGNRDLLRARKADADAIAMQSKEMQKLLDRYDPLGTKLRALAAEFEMLRKAAGDSIEPSVMKAFQGLEDDIDKTKTLMAQAGVVTADTGGKMAQLGLNSQYARRELLMLGKEAMTGEFSRMPHTFGSLIAHSNLLPALLNPITIGIAAIAAAGVGMAVAMVMGRKEAEGMNRALLESGNIAGVTRGQMLRLANTISETGEMSLGVGKQLVTELVASGRIGNQALGAIAGLAADYARTTGADADKLGATLVKMFEDPAKGAETLNKQIHSLTITQREHIRALQESGKLGEAQLALLDVWKSKMVGQTEDVGILTRAWRGLAGAAGSAWDAMLGLGRQTTPEEAVARQQKIVDDMSAKLQLAQQRGGYGEKGYAERLKIEEATLALLTRNLSTTQQIAKAEGESAESNRIVSKLYEGMLTVKSEQIKSIDREITLYKEQRQAIIASGGAEVAIQEKITELQKKRKDLLKGPGGGMTDDAEAALLRSWVKEVENATRAEEEFGKAAEEKTSPSMKKLLDLMGDPKWAKMKESTREAVIALGLEADAREHTLAGLKAEEIARKKAADEADKTRKAISAALAEGQKAEAAAVALQNRGTEAISRQAVALEQRARQLGLTREVMAALAYEETLATIAIEERNLAEAGGIHGSQEMVRAIEERIAALRRLAAAQLEASNAEGDAARLRDQMKAAQDLVKAQEKAAKDSARAWKDAGSEIAASLTKAFGAAGAAAGGMVASFTSAMSKHIELERNFAAQRQDIIVKGFQNNVDVEDDLLKLRADYNGQATQNSLEMFGNMAGAAASYFDRQSTAYKVLTGIEQAMYAVKFAMQVKAMVMDTTSTGASVANSAIRATADGIAAFAKTLASVPFPYNLAAGAVVLAALAAVGVKVAGGGGGGGAGQSSEEYQRTQGTGTVLGDSEAKSQSLLNALDIIKDIDTLGLSYTRQMVDYLSSINASMGSFVTAIVRSSGVLIDPSTSGIEQTTTFHNPIGSTATPGLNFDANWDMGRRWVDSFVNAIFGTTTTNITNSGIGLMGTVGQQLQAPNINNQANTVRGINSFFTVNSQTSGFFQGDGGEHDEWRDLDPNTLRQVQSFIGGIVGSVEEAVKALGLWSPQLHDFLLSLPLDMKLSLEGLKGQELTDAVSSFFSAMADKLAMAALPSVSTLGTSFDANEFWAKFQQAGEGAFETLIRVATEFDVVSHTMAALGMALPGVSMGTLTFSDTLVTLMGGVDKFQQMMGSYAAHYYSPAEQRTITGTALNNEFGSMGMEMPTDLAGFRRLMEGIDRTSEAGAKLYARMLGLESTFYDFTNTVVGLDGQLHTTAEVAEQTNGLQERYAVLTGARTQQAIEREHERLEAMTNGNAAMLEAIYIEEDRQAGLEKQKAQNQARWDLEQELLDLTQTESEALARHRSLRMTELSLREQELGLAPGTLQALQAQIDKQTDLNAAREAEAEAMRVTSDIEGRLGVLRGDFTQQELDRAREWHDAADGYDKAMLTQIYAMEDAKAAAEKLAEALDKATSSQQSMWEQFATDAQKAERANTIVRDGFAALGIAVPASREAFANLVAGIDATTPAGQAMLEALRLIAPAFSTVTAAVGAMVVGIQNSVNGVFNPGQGLPGQIWISTGGNFGYWGYPPGYVPPATGSADDIARQRRQMEIELMEALGKAEEALAARRADILAGLDVSLRGLQQQIWDALDAQKLRDAAKAWSDALNGWLNDMAFSDLSPMTAQQQLQEARRQYDLAKMGDDASALTAAADMLLAADAAVEGFGGGYSALYAQIMADISGLAQTGPLPSVGEAQIVTSVNDLRQEVIDAKAETSRLLERLIEATREGADKVSDAVDTGTTKTASATEQAAAIRERR